MTHKFSLTLAFLVMALSLSACKGPHHFMTGPGHQDFERQLSWQSEAQILSVQGYVLKSNEDAERLKSVWQEMAGLMKNKPGFIEANLNPGAANSKLWLEISRWENVTTLRAAFSDPAVQATVGKLPKIGMSHIFAASQGGYVN